MTQPTLAQAHHAYADALATTIAECDGLNLLMRPLVKRMFRQSVGVDANELLARSHAVDDALSRGVTCEDDVASAEKVEQFLGREVAIARGR